MKIASNSFAKIFFLFFLFALVRGEASSEGVVHDNYIIHSIPKCGTHFIQKIAHLLTGKDIVNQNINEANLNKADQGNYVIRTFEPYKSETIQLLKRKRFKTISMIRDPRDALVSFVFYMRTFANRPQGAEQRRDFFVVSPDFDDLSFDDQLTLAITGGPTMNSYLDFYMVRAGWGLDSHCLRVKFEDLVGSDGGGSDRLKRKAVVDIANYLHVDVTEEHLDHVLDNMYDHRDDTLLKDKVFTRGSIGNWKTFFKSKHKKLFKNMYADILFLFGYEEDDNW